MPRRTYHQQVKQQKERARKARQEEKQQRRSVRVNPADASNDESEGPTAQSAALSPPVPEVVS